MQQHQDHCKYVQSYGSTGWKSITYTATTSGTFRLGFGSFNWGDGGVHPILIVSMLERSESIAML